MEHLTSGHVHKYEASLWILENWEKYLFCYMDRFQCYILKNFRGPVYYRYISAKFVKNQKYCFIAEKR